MDVLEQDALEISSLVRFTKNTFVSINRIPQEIFSFILGYCDTDEELVACTHVCRGWREQLISRSSLWTSLDCRSVEQTRAYLERVRPSPLDIRLEEGEEEEGTPFLNDAFLLTIPHLGRLKNLTLSGSSDNLLQLTKYFCSPAPLLEKLNSSSPVRNPPLFRMPFSTGTSRHCAN